VRPLKVVTRVLSFVGKEIMITVRRPGALISLVIGPFLILAIFGYGYTGFRRPLDTVIVIPPNSGLPRDPSFYAELAGAPLNIVEVGENPEGARGRLQRREVELVMIAPADAGARFRAGQQEVITVLYDEIDPVGQTYISVLAQEFSARVNRELIAGAVRGGERFLLDAGGRSRPIPPEVVAAPTTTDIDNLAPISPSVIAFFAPAVLALILQHMAVTLTALALVRERLGGAMELFRLSPTSAGEILAGKYFAFGLLNVVVAGLTIGLMVLVLHVPLLSNVPFVVLIILLLSFASLGVGLLISALADSERQAVQLALLVLLASVFFSGFAVPLRDFDPAVRDLAYALPVTHGIRLLQDAFLRGTWTSWNMGALILIGVSLLLATNFVLVRSLRPR
jgi:ABC-2 type transport system permease protein